MNRGKNLGNLGRGRQGGGGIGRDLDSFRGQIAIRLCCIRQVEGRVSCRGQ